MDFFTFINNAGLLLVLSLLSINIQLRWLKHESTKNIVLGILYGLFAVIAMSAPMELQPGVFFDGRSVILSLAGLFTGNITTLIACIIASAARIYLGGPGVFTGVGSVIISGLAGIIFRKLVNSKGIRLNLGYFFAFGFIVHLVLVIWFFTLPVEIALSIIKNIALPYLTVFPLATMLIGGFMDEQQQHLLMEKNLAESEKRYRDLVNTLNEGVWETNAEAVTTFINPKMADMLGYTPDELIGKPVSDFVPEVDHPKLDAFHKRRQQGIKEQYEFRFIRKNGTRLIAQLGVTPVMNEKGEFIGTLAGVQDITDLKKTQRELANQSRHLEELVEERTLDLKNAQSQLIRAEKLATLGELAGSVGHELRNPLAVISNSVYLLKNSISKPDANLKEYIDMIEVETHNASRIINDLLDYSRIQPTLKEQVRMQEIFSRVLGQLALPAQIQIINNIQGDIPPVNANPQQVEQILNNLVTNAVEAMPDGGKISLDAKTRKNRLIITISDTGIGIPGKNLKRIFEPLFTTKPRGIGLGLAITAKLAELNDISIQVKSKVGQGTTFTLAFLLPV